MKTFAIFTIVGHLAANPFRQTIKKRGENTNIKKARVAELSPVPHFQASRIALPTGTSNAEAHADMREAAQRVCKKDTMRAVHTYPEDIYHCFVLCWHSSLRDFESVRTKASSKRLIYKCIPPTRFCISHPKKMLTEQQDASKVQINLMEAYGFAKKSEKNPKKKKYYSP